MKRKQLQARYSTIASTLALVIALTGAGAYAIETIKKNSVGAKQIKKNAVRGAEIKGSAVKSADINDGAVEAEDLTLPAPAVIDLDTEVGTPPEPGATYAPLATVGTFEKAVAESALQVSWSGVITGRQTSCVFQVRVDGLPAPGVGEVVVAPGDVSNVATEIPFGGLAAGPHSVEIWVRAIGDHPAPDWTCTLSPASAGIGQTVAIQEVPV